MGDKKIIDFLKSLLIKIKLRPLEYKDKRFNCIRIRTHSKELYSFMKEGKVLEDRDFKIGYISGFIDSDGYYSRKKSTLIIVNTNLEKLTKTKQFLEDLYVKSSLNKKFMAESYKQQPYNLFISVKFISLKSLSKKIELS